MASEFRAGQSGASYARLRSIRRRSAYDGGRISLAAQRAISNLDGKLREQMRVEVKRLQRQLNIALLFVTHDQVGALSLSNRSEWGS